MVFYFAMKGPVISDNILRLSADMENLRGLDKQATRVCNTEGGMFKYLISALYDTSYRVAFVCLV